MTEFRLERVIEFNMRESLTFYMTVDGTDIALADVFVDDDDGTAFLGSVAVNPNRRGHGYDAQLIRHISDVYGSVIAIADDDDEKQLYASLGVEYTRDDAWSYDLGYGVYVI